MRDKGNFTELISILREDIAFYKNAIASGEAKPDRHPSLRRAIFSSTLDTSQALYSNGAKKEEVKDVILNCIPAFENSFRYEDGFGQYDEIIWLLSISVLCDIDVVEFKRITAILQRDQANDKLLSQIIKAKDSTWEESTASPLQEHPYAKAVDIKSASDIKLYLDKVWYQGHSDAAWHDTHLNKQVNCYAGYWAWEVAAIAKIKGIDDSSLKTQKYYPYDAVHW